MCASTQIGARSTTSKKTLEHEQAEERIPVEVQETHYILGILPNEICVPKRRFRRRVVDRLAWNRIDEVRFAMGCIRADHPIIGPQQAF